METNHFVDKSSVFLYYNTKVNSLIVKLNILDSVQRLGLLCEKTLNLYVNYFPTRIWWEIHSWSDKTTHILYQKYETSEKECLIFA